MESVDVLPIAKPALFAKDRRGTSTLMFGLVSIPLIGAVGAMSDYSTAADARTKLQAVADSVALKLAKNHTAKTDAELQAEGDALVRTLMIGRADATVGTVTVTRASQKINVVAAGTATARFSKFFGAGNTPIKATAQSVWGNRKLEIALVLDNTLSMNSSGKMTALKTAATNFINTMEAAATEADSVKIAIVPFNTTIKVGTAYASASWLTMNYIASAQRPSWDGCVMDRDQPYDVSDDLPVPGTLATLYPARMCPQSSLASIAPLSTNFGALRSKISSMTPAGYTNVTIGVAWGHVMLSNQAPMTEAAAYGTANVDKIMIVLTDGDNTQNRWTTTSSQIDQRTQLACSAAKANNIRIYTIRVIEGNASLLRGCATSTSMYYNVTSAAQLNPVFAAIAQSIQNLRLTN
jgi:Flp pilus assembly protein TadG